MTEALIRETDVTDQSERLMAETPVWKTAARDTSLNDRWQRHQFERHTSQIQPGDMPKIQAFLEWNVSLKGLAVPSVLMKMLNCKLLSTVAVLIKHMKYRKYSTRPMVLVGQYCIRPRLRVPNTLFVVNQFWKLPQTNPELESVV